MADQNSRQNPDPGVWQARLRARLNGKKKRDRRATATTANASGTTKKEKKQYKVLHKSVYWYAVSRFVTRFVHFAFVVGVVVLIAWAFWHEPEPREVPGNYNVVSPSERFPYLDPDFEREEASKLIPIGGDGELGFKKGE